MFYCNRSLPLFFLFSILSTTFTSEKAPISYLKLFPEKELEAVHLGHPYHHMTEEEKRTAKLVLEGNYTILTDENDCALVGPLQPCQLLCFSLKEKTIVIHIAAQSNLNLLLNTIKNKFSDHDFSTVSGELFTNNVAHYNIPMQQNKQATISYCQIYQNRTQIEELKYNKDQIINIFGIHNRNQINAYKFNSKKNDFELGDYEFAELFVFIKIINNKPIIFNICPMAENYFGNFAHLSLRQRIAEWTKQLVEARNKNPFLQLKVDDVCKSYGSIPFFYV